VMAPVPPLVRSPATLARGKIVPAVAAVKSVDGAGGAGAGAIANANRARKSRGPKRPWSR
jgi:hypothetical protein